MPLDETLMASDWPSPRSANLEPGKLADLLVLTMVGCEAGRDALVAW